MSKHTGKITKITIGGHEIDTTKTFGGIGDASREELAELAGKVRDAIKGLAESIDFNMMLITPTGNFTEGFKKSMQHLTDFYDTPPIEPFRPWGREASPVIRTKGRGDKIRFNRMDHMSHPTKYEVETPVEQARRASQEIINRTSAGSLWVPPCIRLYDEDVCTEKQDPMGWMCKRCPLDERTLDGVRYVYPEPIHTLKTTPFNVRQWRR